MTAFPANTAFINIIHSTYQPRSCSLLIPTKAPSAPGRVPRQQSCPASFQLSRTMEDRRADQPSGDPIPEPEPAHIVDDEQATQPDDEQEATELRAVSTAPHSAKRRKISRIISPDKSSIRWHDPFTRAWRHHIRLSVPHVDCRDHLGKSVTRVTFGVLASCTGRTAGHIRGSI
jgi:hypothetical protein